MESNLSNYLINQNVQQSVWSNVELSPFTPKLTYSKGFNQPIRCNDNLIEPQEWLMNRFLDTTGSINGSLFNRNKLFANSNAHHSNNNNNQFVNNSYNYNQLSPLFDLKSTQSFNSFNKNLSAISNNSINNTVNNCEPLLIGDQLTKNCGKLDLSTIWSSSRDDLWYKQTFNSVNQQQRLATETTTKLPVTSFGSTPVIPTTNPSNRRSKPNILQHQEMILSQLLGLYHDDQKDSPQPQQHSTPITVTPQKYQAIQSPFLSPLIKNNEQTFVGSAAINQQQFNPRKLRARQESDATGINQLSTTDQQTNEQRRRKSKRSSCVECVFCKNNDQPASFYRSHVLKDPLGQVTCPILRAYNCPICHNGGGPKAHTIRYCPQNKPSQRLRNALLKSKVVFGKDESIF